MRIYQDLNDFHHDLTFHFLFGKNFHCYVVQQNFWVGYYLYYNQYITSIKSTRENKFTLFSIIKYFLPQQKLVFHNL